MKSKLCYRVANGLLPKHLDHVHILRDKSVNIYFNMGILFYPITVASYFPLVSIEVYNIDMFLKTCVLKGVVRACQSKKTLRTTS